MEKVFYEKHQIDVKWTGKYPNLCSGYWQIKIDNKEIKDKNNVLADGKTGYGGNPYKYDALITRNMGTEGTYSSWHFEENYNEVFEDYYERENGDWWQTPQAKFILELLHLNGIVLKESELNELYNKISSEDWRSNSCGGCI